MSSIASEKEKVLTRSDLTAIAVGNVIGGGIMSVVGIAIGLTGRSVVIALVICAVMTLISILPQCFASATVRMHGGEYTLAALLGGKIFAGIYVAFWLTNFFGASLYCTSFSQYIVSSLIPSANPTVWAMGLLAVIFILNLLGIKVAAKAQNILVVVLLAALLAFSFFGFGHVKPGFFDPPDFSRNGFAGIMYAAALMNFACGGAGHIVSFGRQSKNPTRDIPIAIVLSSVIVAVIYTMVAIVASGVLPIQDIEGQPLTKVALEVLPTPVYIFFIVGGAICALVTSLNALMGWLPPPVVQACEDGWLPKKFGVRNKRFNTPHWVLLFIFIMASVILLTGWDVDSIATAGTFLSNVGTMIVVIALIRMPKILPELWAKSMFKIPNWLYGVVCMAALLICIVFEYFLFAILDDTQKIGMIVYTAIAIVYAVVMTKIKSGKQVHIELSYEGA